MSLTISAHGVFRIDASFKAPKTDRKPFACVDLTVSQDRFNGAETTNLTLFFDDIDLARRYADAINSVAAVASQDDAEAA